MSKNIFIISTIILLLCSCKDKTVDNEQISVKYRGVTFLEDTDGNFFQNKSGIKVTVLETGVFTYTDSTGIFLFDKLILGVYTFKYEYDNFPIFYTNDVKISSLSDTLMNGSNIPTLSPKPTHNFILDSIQFGLNVDTTTINIHFQSINSKPKHYFNNLFLFSKTRNNLDYYSGKYDYIVPTIRWYIDSTTYARSFHPFSYTQLKSFGFNQGDSLYIKFYSLGSIDSYVDKNTNKKVFPFIDKESNVISTILR